jgi:hypothetical protein
MPCEDDEAHKSPVLKILTSKLFAIKILQTLFANPAPRNPFRGYVGRGVPPSNWEL